MKYIHQIAIFTLMASVIFITSSGQRRRLRRLSRTLGRIHRKVNTSLTRMEGHCNDAEQAVNTVLEDLEGMMTRCNTTVSTTESSLIQLSSEMDALNDTVDEIDMAVNETSIRFCLDVPESVKECFNSYAGAPIDPLAIQVMCLQDLLWEFEPVPDDTRTHVEKMRDYVNLTNTSVPPTGTRVRKEYRTLSFEERTRYHNALKQLYQNGVIRLFGEVHAIARARAHDGPGFLPWHRGFLAMYEEALRSVDPSVSLPYWDSSIDNDMDNPVNSVLWTHEYLGNGAGIVDEGPFADWVSKDGKLERSFGKESRLISKDDVEMVLDYRRCYFQNMSSLLEMIHGGVHVWIGGDMKYPETAAFDPVFYMHHCYIDYIWERFRRHQLENCGVDPSGDFIGGHQTPGHHIDDDMIGMEFYKVGEGLANWWTGGSSPWYTYERSPDCPFCSDARTLSCDALLQTCIPNSQMQIVQRSTPAPPATTPIPPTTPTSGPPLSTKVTELQGMKPQVQRHETDETFDILPAPPLDLPPVQFAENTIEKAMKREAKSIPRNRGIPFLGRPSKRTLATARTDFIRFRDMRQGL